MYNVITFNLFNTHLIINVELKLHVQEHINC